MTRSILDDLGAEVTGIVSPVSICMALTVLLVRVLNPEGTADPTAVAIANVYYHEQVSLEAESKRVSLSFEGCCLHWSPINLTASAVLQDDDSTGTKITGAVINAGIFVVFVGLLTFGLVLLYKYGVRCLSPA